VIVEKVEVTARQAADFGERVVDSLSVEPFSALEESVFVAEVAVLRASTRYDDGVGNEIKRAADQVTANGRDALQRPA